MAIVYSCIAKGHIILADVSLRGGDFQGTALNLIRPSPMGPLSRDSFQRGSFNYYTLFNNGITYVCATEKNMDSLTAYRFLDEICKIFVESPLINKVAFAHPFELSADLNQVLGQNMADYSAKPSSGKLDNVQEQVNDVKNILSDNLNKVLERGERLNDLIDKTDDLQATAETFQKTSTRIARKMWWKNKKMLAIIVVIVIIIIIIILLLATNVIPT
ncbi:vesicle-associated membrane protein 8 isoform X1 [Huso huso]|uniref:Vesicle-associated membrane protein 7 n=1 Tax=Huso huso TaxID=61971 RepID=A0ABR1A6C6_HUSHU